MAGSHIYGVFDLGQLSFRDLVSVEPLPTRVNDDTDEQTMDSLRLYALDPRYTSLIDQPQRSPVVRPAERSFPGTTHWYWYRAAWHASAVVAASRDWPDKPLSSDDAFGAQGAQPATPG